MAAALEFFVSTTNMNDAVHTILEAAKLEKVSPDTIRREIWRGNLKAYRVGRSVRIKHADLIKARRPVVNAPELRGGGQDDVDR